MTPTPCWSYLFARSNALIMYLVLLRIKLGQFPFPSSVEALLSPLSFIKWRWWLLKRNLVTDAACAVLLVAARLGGKHKAVWLLSVQQQQHQYHQEMLVGWKVVWLHCGSSLFLFFMLLFFLLLQHSHGIIISKVRCQKSNYCVLALEACTDQYILDRFMDKIHRNVWYSLNLFSRFCLEKQHGAERSLSVWSSPDISAVFTCTRQFRSRLQMQRERRHGEADESHHHLQSIIRVLSLGIHFKTWKPEPEM